MGEIAGLAIGGGVFAVMATVISLLLVGMRADRRQYEETIEKAEARADHARADAQAAWSVAEEARRGRHVAEDALAELRRARGIGP